MRLLWPLLLIALAAPALGAESRDEGATRAAAEEAGDAARREQAELRDRAEALREQQATTDALLEKQEAYLKALERQVEALKQQRRDGAS
ncbi:hypothetical protein ACLD02_11970 [Alloalcanivorax sp. C16-2]|uniref:hypothetical protein n=1 Tax=Alloalcanivorax TaxID=3020832 RepID=UPI00193408F1|nr:hypothetical protein [Alloalcanivorax marinus]MBL7251617.1 hypothetical protein [Alloalcanivorax marinus]